MTLRLPLVFCRFFAGPSRLAGLLAVLGAANGLIDAAPTKPAPALSFQLESRFDYRDASGTAGPSQTYSGKVLVQGDRARFETSVGGRPVVLIVAPPYFYKILPSAKSARRHKLSDNGQAKGLVGAVPADWMRHPESLRAMLKKQGAKPGGTATLDGVAVEVWKASQLPGQLGAGTVWLRRTDGLPVKVEVDGEQMKIAVRWSDYRTVKVPPAGAFAPPAGFKVRDAQE